MCETKNFYFWLLQVVGLVGLLVLVLWLSLRPRQPTYTIVQFSVPTPTNTSTTPANSTFSYQLEIVNPNKDSGIFYDETVLRFYYGQETLYQKTMPSFYQGKDRTTIIMESVNVDGRVWKQLSSEVSKATAEVKVAAETKIRYKMWGRTSRRQGLNLQAKLQIGSDGKIKGKKKKKIKLHHNSKKWTSKLAS